MAHQAQTQATPAKHLANKTRQMPPKTLHPKSRLKQHLTEARQARQAQATQARQAHQAAQAHKPHQAPQAAKDKQAPQSLAPHKQPLQPPQRQTFILTLQQLPSQAIWAQTQTLYFQTQ
jgi:hypothetical protein